MKTTLLNKLGLAIVAIAAITSSSYAQTVINNEKIRVGNGTETSINTRGNMQQPFYKSADVWYKLTYSSYALNAAFAVGGDGTNDWNLNGTLLTDPLMANQVIDESGFTYNSGSNGPGTGVIVSTGEISVDGRELQVQKTYELLPDKSFIKIKVKLTNQSAAAAENVRVWIGTKDDWVGTTDGPLKERGNLVDGNFEILTDPTQRAKVVRVTTNNEGVLFYTDTDKASGIIQHCCSFDNVTSQDPALAEISNSWDGSYGFYVRMNDLEQGESDEFTWYYAAGQIDELDEITNEVAQASGAISEVTCTSASFSASSSANGTGYYVVVPANEVAPTAEEIKAGSDYGTTTVVNSGNTAVVGGNSHVFEFTGLSHSTDYIVYFVVEDESNQFSNITEVNFSSGAPPAITFDIAPTTTCSTIGDGSALANVTGGTAPYSFSWSEGETTAEITDKSAGDYSLSVTDNGGCPSVEATATIGLNDQTAPTVVTKDIQVYLDEAGNASIAVDAINDESHDDCAIADLTLSQTDFACADVSETNGVNVMLTATDESGNFASNSASVVVLDTISPKLFTQDITVALDASGNGVISADMADNGSYDNCSIANLSLSKTEFTCADLGENQVILTATDASDNSSQAALVVRVVDEIAPTATFEENAVIYLDAEGHAEISEEGVIAQTSDNCSVASISFDVEPFSCADIGLKEVNATVTDAAGNSSIVAGQVLIADTIKPDFNIESIELESDSEGNASLTADMLLPYASDACGVSEIILEGNTFNCATSGGEIDVTVVDVHGNAKNFPLQVILTDDVPPVLTAEGATVSLPEDGRLNLNAEMLNVEASDNCGNVEVTLSETRLNCADLGMVPVILTATDESGNESQYTVMVEVIDDLAPEINVESKVYLCVGTPLNYNAFASVSDNCEATLTQIAGPVNGSQLEPGLYNLRFKAEDASGNTAYNGTLLEVLEYPEVDLGEDVNAALGSLVGLTAGTDPELNYEWSTGQNTPYAEIYVMGDMNVSVAVSNIGGCTSYDDVDIFASTAMSTSDGEDGNSFSLYPNPATDQINLSFGLNGSINGATIRITDMQGKIVGIERVARLRNGETHSLNVNNLSQGLYLVTISNSEVRMTTKFSKQ